MRSREAQGSEQLMSALRAQPFHRENAQKAAPFRHPSCQTLGFFLNTFFASIGANCATTNSPYRGESNAGKFSAAVIVCKPRGSKSPGAAGKFSAAVSGSLAPQGQISVFGSGSPRYPVAPAPQPNHSFKRTASQPLKSNVSRHEYCH